MSSHIRGGTQCNSSTRLDNRCRICRDEPYTTIDKQWIARDRISNDSDVSRDSHRNRIIKRAHASKQGGGDRGRIANDRRVRTSTCGALTDDNFVIRAAARRSSRRPYINVVRARKPSGCISRIVARHEVVATRRIVRQRVRAEHRIGGYAAWTASHRDAIDGASGRDVPRVGQGVSYEGPLACARGTLSTRGKNGQTEAGCLLNCDGCIVHVVDSKGRTRWKQNHEGVACNIGVVVNAAIELLKYDAEALLCDLPDCVACAEARAMITAYEADEQDKQMIAFAVEEDKALRLIEDRFNIGEVNYFTTEDEKPSSN